MHRACSSAERLCKRFVKTSQLQLPGTWNVPSGSQGIRQKHTIQSLCINGSLDPVRVLKACNFVDPSTSNGFFKVRDKREEAEEVRDKQVEAEGVDIKESVTSLTGYSWRTVRLTEAALFYENGLLPKPTVDDLVHIIQKCRHEKEIAHAMQWHAYVRKCGLDTHTLLGNELVLTLAELGQTHDAWQLFNRLLNRSECAWSSLIRGFVKCGKPQHAVSLYYQMQNDSRVYPSTYAYVALLKACAKLNDLKTGLHIHAKVAVSGQLRRTLCLGSALVHMYAECGSLAKAQQVFNGLRSRNAVSWNALITAYVKHGCGEEALQKFEQMQIKGLVPSSVTYLCVLKACGSTGAIVKGQEIHVELERTRLLEKDLAIGNTLVYMYAKCGFLAKARQVFDRLGGRDVVSWNALITGYGEHEQDEEVLELLEKMQREEFYPDAITLVCGLKACSNLGALYKGEEIHAEIERKGWLEKDCVAGNALVVMYSKCGLVAKARQVFDKLLVRDVIAWNALIAGYADYGHEEEALECYELMAFEGISPDSVTFLCSLKACGSLGATGKGQELHVEIEKKGLLENNYFLGSALVDMYAKSGFLAKAQQVFERLPVRNVVAWTALISGYAEQGAGEQALKFFEQMQQTGVPANAVTFVGVLKACGSIGASNRGRDVHGEIERTGLLEGNIVLGSTLVDMYIKCGLLAKARQVFDKLVTRDAVSWTALVAGYAEHGQAEEALNMLERMRLEGVSTDAVTLVCSLKVCGSIGATNKGVELHAEIAQKGLLGIPVVGTTLVDMYSKCGSLSIAQQVFDKLSFRDVVSWNSLIAGYAQHKGSNNVFDTFDKMLGEGINPDHVTFLIMLNACSSAGFLHESQTYFEAMSEKYGITPTVEHYNCMVDILCQAGQLDKAILLTKKKSWFDGVAWRNVLGACKNWGNVEVARQAFQHAIDL